MWFHPIYCERAEDWARQTVQQLLEAKRELATFPEADVKYLLLKTQRPI